MTYEFIKQFLINHGSQGYTKGPGLIRITLPGSMNHRVITGILTSDISVSVGTNYGSIIPDLSMLADIGAMTGAENITTWIGTSALVWKGTDPIRFGAEMYLVNYAPNLGYEEDLEALTKMCTLLSSSRGDITKNFQARVHGGYSPDIFANNAEYMSAENINGKYTGIFGKITDAFSLMVEDKEASVGEKFKAAKESLTNASLATNITGTITVEIGSKFKMGLLLLTKIDVTPSLVEVLDRSTGESKPLYYRVQMSFTTCRAAVETDVSGMFGLGG